MTEVSMSLLADGWVRVDKGIPGWESHEVQVRVVLVDGEPRVVGLRLEPRVDPTVTDDEAAAEALRGLVLTGNRLRGLPVSTLAGPAWGMANLAPVWPERLHEMQREAADRPRAGRQVTTVEQVAALYLEALTSGSGKPRAYVCGVLCISSRTADRYIAQARREGMIPGYRGQGGKRTTGEEEQA